MFCLIRHAEYLHETGALTPEGSASVTRLAGTLVKVHPDWKEIRASRVTRTRETANILSQALKIPVETDERISSEGDLGDLLPPTEPKDIIFVTHLPVMTRLLRVWSRHLDQEEPPMALHAGGYIVDPENKRISPI